MNAIPARISDQLDAPVIDHELQKMLLPKVFDMFKYVCVPSTNTTSNISDNANLIPNFNIGRSLHFQSHDPQSNDINLLLQKIAYRFTLYCRWVRRHILPKFAFQTEEQKKEFLSIASEVLYFILTLGMDRPTPSMALLGLKLIPNPSNNKRNNFANTREGNRVSSRDRMNLLSQSNQVGKKRLLLLLSYSILLPKLYKAIISRYLNSNSDNDTFPVPPSNLGSDIDANNTRLPQPELNLQTRARIRRKEIIRRIHEIVKKIIPLMRLLNFIYFLQNTSFTTKAFNQHSSNFINLPPPTLAMRFSGVSYAYTPTYSAFHESMTGTRSAQSMDESQLTSTALSSSSKQSPESSRPLQIHQLTNNRSINYIYAHRRLLYLELMRTLWAIIPFSPNQLTQWSRSASFSSIRNRAIDYVSNMSKRWNLTRNSSSLSHTVRDRSNVKEIASLPCTICKIQPIPIPYITSCNHLYCYTCLRNAVTVAETDEWSLFHCGVCGKEVKSSKAL